MHRLALRRLRLHRLQLPSPQGGGGAAFQPILRETGVGGVVAVQKHLLHE